MITRDNYESFFLDYLEGNLEETMIDQFLDFLEQNPDLKGELQLFENVRLPEEQVLFSGKKKLYKSTAEEKLMLENNAVAYLEGDLNDDEQKSFEACLASHPEMKKEYKLLAKTRLIPDLRIKYTDKHKLHRQTRTTVFINWSVRAAAAVVLIWGISLVIQNQKQPGSPQLFQQLAENPNPTLPVNKPESVKRAQVAEVQVKGNEKEEVAVPVNRKSVKVQPDDQKKVQPQSEERELTTIPAIAPIFAQLESEPVGNQLAFSHSTDVNGTNASPNRVTIDEFLASRVRKVGSEGLFSAQRIVRAGLGVAAELSGERIGYSVKDGKISSVDFESKILAFSIPLTKK